MSELTKNNTFGYGSGNPDYGNGSNGGDEPKENVRHFAELLFELSKYNPDLKAILDNSKLSVKQNQDSEFEVNNYNMFNGQIEPNPFENLNIGDSGENVNPNKDKQSNIDKIDNINENNIAEVTADSIYNLLTSQQYVIIVDVSKLPESLKQTVNKLTNNNDLNNQNEMGTENTNYSATALPSQNNMQSNNATDKQNDAQSVALNPDQFQELIYYFIINAVAKDRGTSVLSNQNTDKPYNDILQEIKEKIYNKNNNSYDQNNNSNSNAYQVYRKYRDDINNINKNRDLRQCIRDESDQQRISINFWGPFLWDVLKRASFSYSLYKAIQNNHRKDKIDAVLGLPHVLFILSLIFGWGAIANAILGFIFLVSLVYKAIDQCQQTRPRYLLYSLLRTKTFCGIASRLDYALVPKAGNLYKFYIQCVKPVDVSDNGYNNGGTPMQDLQGQDLYLQGQKPYANFK